MTTLKLDDGFFVKPWGAGMCGHLAIGGKAICGIGDVRPASFRSNLKPCARCKRVAAAYDAAVIDNPKEVGMKTKCRNQDHTGEPHSLDQSCLVDGVKTKPQTHTQGPWEVGGIGPDKYLVVKRNPVNLLVTAAIAEAAKEEDARLIAAAPDLLAFIESKRHIFQGKPATGQDFADFLAIISRAEGRE